MLHKFVAEMLILVDAVYIPYMSRTHSSLSLYWAYLICDVNDPELVCVIDALQVQRTPINQVLN